MATLVNICWLAVRWLKYTKNLNLNYIFGRVAIPLIHVGGVQSWYIYIFLSSLGDCDVAKSS